ncbi:hypothetical protein BCR43DRAFT_483689 [Syncephalastrum racemosum]|uniref:MYND-type domain-containing protein n=1 Tax=Syncephalastrum racemosum TaxID=13706 RepID=A0A1X2HVP0_SYNRA|nr:hypothetical protein BCR43DRAFT_483689 [Syncephalastrum racemosum]
MPSNRSIVSADDKKSVFFSLFQKPHALKPVGEPGFWEQGYSHKTPGAVHKSLRLLNEHRHASCRCKTAISFHLSMLRYYKKQVDEEFGTLVCSRDLLEVVWQICQVLLEHTEQQPPSNKYYASLRGEPWLEQVQREIWDLGKQLKDESVESDYVTPGDGREQEVWGVAQQQDDQELYRRAIRISIYFSRALLYQHQHNLDKALMYYRKCLSVRPVPRQLFETQYQVQQSAWETMEALQSRHEQMLHEASISTTSLDTSSESSESSTSSPRSCGQCGAERRVMPVCARCRTQAYCSRRCLTEHQPVHKTTCRGMTK